MKWLGYKRLAFKSVRMDVPDIRRRSKERHVTDLAADIREHGDEPIHAPTIRMPRKELLCGRDRMAALLITKAKRLWVRLAECSDLEAADLEASENIHRRQDSRSDVIAKAVSVKERLLSEREGVTVSQAPQHSAKAAARRAVARAAGVSTGAVRQAEHRAKKRAESSATVPGETALSSAPAAEAEEPAPTLNLLGCDDSSTRTVMKFARPIQEAIDEADRHLRLAQTAIARMPAGALQQDLKEQVRRLASLVRSHRPESICPWCKGLPKATIGSCGGCGGDGFVSAEKVGRAPSECFFRDPPLVVINGKSQPYADVRDGKVKPGVNGAPVIGKPIKKISVTLADGTDADLDL